MKLPPDWDPKYNELIKELFGKEEAPSFYTARSIEIAWEIKYFLRPQYQEKVIWSRGFLEDTLYPLFPLEYLNKKSKKYCMDPAHFNERMQFKRDIALAMRALNMKEYTKTGFTVLAWIVPLEAMA